MSEAAKPDVPPPRPSEDEEPPADPPPAEQEEPIDIDGITMETLRENRPLPDGFETDLFS